MLAPFVGGQPIVEPRLACRCLQYVPDDWLFRLNPFHPNWYDREAFDIEGQVAFQLVARGETTFHFLYGEHSHRWAAKVNRWAGHRNRVVATYHQLPSFFEQRRKQYQHVRNLDAIILIASNQCEFFESVAGSDKVHVIPHGVDTEFFRPSPTAQNDDHPLTCLTVGSNYRDFGAHVQVIRAVNRSALRGVQFVVVGEPRCAVHFAGLENVRYLSGISDDELLCRYQTADVLLLPLADATACNALLEGMACGLATVVTEVGGRRDYVDEECALLVPSGNPDALIEQVTGILQQEARRRALGTAARERAVTRFDWKFIADQMRSVYATLW
jgi:glycosyltransferase involved in cell wall biosynthesis